MRFWPFISRTVHALECQRRDDQIADLTRQRDYWRLRAERLTDAALARAGAIHEPTMVDRKPTPKDARQLLTAALSITEIDSTKTKGAA